VKLQIGIALLTVRDENGFYGVQHDPFGGDQAGAPQDELQHSYGFLGRPLDAEKGRGCSIWYDFDEKEGHAFLGHDPRAAEKIPPVKKGGSVQYASDGSFAVFDPETHTWTLYVPYADSPAKAHLVTVGLDGNNTPIIELASGEGLALTLLGRVLTAKNASGSAYITLDDEGTNVVGPFKAAGGADLGGPTSAPLAKATELLSWATEVVTALASLGVTLPPLPPTVATETTKGA
jgi:hypothetical protein